MRKARRLTGKGYVDKVFKGGRLGLKVRIERRQWDRLGWV